MVTYIYSIISPLLNFTSKFLDKDFFLLLINIDYLVCPDTLIQGLSPFNYINTYYILLIFFIISFCLSIILFFLSYILGTSTIVLDVEKLSAYECGFSPINESRQLVDLKFYKTAILFLIFDIEIIFLLPWSNVLLNNSFLSLNYLKLSLPFLFVLFLGIVIEYKDRLFDW